jgi:hypothetical protein
MRGGFHIGRSGIGIRTRQDWGLQLEAYPVAWSLHILRYFLIRVNTVVLGREPLCMRVSRGRVQAGVRNIQGGVRAELVIITQTRIDQTLTLQLGFGVGRALG